MVKNVNLLCLDMAPLTRFERRLLLLHLEHGLTPFALAEVFQVESMTVHKTLRSARQKYLHYKKRVVWSA